MKTSSILSNSTNTHRSTPNSFDFFYTKKAPMPIQQTKISMADQMIKQIPFHPNPEHILHLYLSHNKIESLKGLQKFIHLQSFNISYNLLSRKQEFNEYMNVASCTLKRLSIKKNSFQYGIEDYAVQFFKNIQKLDDVILGDKNRKKAIWISKMKISDKIIEALLRTDRLLLFLQDMNKKDMLNSELNIKKQKSNNSLKLIHENIQQSATAQLGLMRNVQKGNQVQILQNCIKIISIFLQSDLKCTCRPYNYRQQSQKKFAQILRQIMVRFSARNNRCFAEGLQRIIKEKSYSQESQRLNPNKNSNLGVKIEYIMAFARMGGYQFKMEQNPGKYIKKITSSQLRKNPMNQFIERQTKQKSEQSNTLKGPGQSKWERLLQLKQRSQKQNDSYFSNINRSAAQGQIEEQWIFEKVPIFVYQKNYVQIIYQMLFEKRTQIITIYNKINYSKGEVILEIGNINQNINEKKKEKVKKMKQIKQPHQKLIKSGLQLEEQIMTFKGNNQDSLDFIEPYEQSSVRQTQYKGNIAGSNRQFKNQRQETRIPSHDSSYNQTKRVASNENEDDNTVQIGYKKYSLHQVNIIYKTLRSLKKNMLKRRRQRV